MVRVLSRELSPLTPDAVLRELIHFRATEGTLFADYLRDLRILAANVQCLGAKMTPDQAQVQSAFRTAIQDQFPGISGHDFAGRDDHATPFDSLESLMTRLDAFRSNTMRAHGPRLGSSAGGGVMRNRHTPKASPGRFCGGSVMSITEMRDLDGEDREMEYVYMMGRGNSDKFGRSQDPPFHEPFPTRELKNKARQAYGPYCFNCGSADWLMSAPRGTLTSLV